MPRRRAREAEDSPVATGAASAPGPARFLGAREVAEYLQINEKKVYALAREGRLPGTRVTGKWLFPRELVDQWLIESSHGGVLADRLVIAGSDDPLLHRVVAHLAEATEGRALVSYTPTGTRLGLKLLAAGRADVAAIHWGPAEESRVRHPALIRTFPEHPRWVMVRAFLREQGLLLSPEIAEHDRRLATLVTPRFRWAARQAGAGSQRFLEEALAGVGATPASLDVVATVRTEREAASAIAMGQAQVAPGCHSAATEAGLAFLSTGWEAFDLVLHRGVFFRTLLQKLLDDLKGFEAQEIAVALDGYEFEDLGKLVWAAQE